jgi:hypothetical protein
MFMILETRPHRLALLLVVTSAVCTLFAATVAYARDDTPAEILNKSNPVELEETELRYYKRQWKGKCSRCHGVDGKGGGKNAAAQLVPPTNFTDVSHMQTRTDGQLFYQILMGGGDRCAMPAFGPESDYAWNEDKIWHLVAYVRRFATTTSD